MQEAVLLRIDSQLAQGESEANVIYNVRAWLIVSRFIPVISTTSI